MHWFSIGVAVLVALAIGTLGILYLARPKATMPSFGLPLPRDDTNVFPWLRLKGSRDVASGLVVLALVAWGEARVLGLVLLILAIIPLGDMSVILAARGSKGTAFGVHGATAALMVAAAVLLLIGQA